MLTGIEILRQDALAGGAAFGDAGAYVRIVGRARGEVDPAHPANRGIALIDRAPRNAAGRVEYAADLHVLRPADPARGNGRILHEVNNRGRKLLLQNLCAGAGGNDPQSAGDLGNALPLHMGFTLVWSGWDPAAPRANGGLALDAPVATDGGRPITGAVRDEFVPGTRLGPMETFRLSSEADGHTGRLTVRPDRRSPAEEIPASAWEFVDARTVRLLPAGTMPRTGAIYEFTYRARNPRVQGLGFAATRDVASFLRHAPDALAVTGRAPTHALAFGISQAARYLRDHVARGFNLDEAGRRVFDGILAHVGGIGRVFFDTPFGQPFRTRTRHEDRFYPENAFPFSSATLDDPLTGASGALMRGDAGDPLLIETNSSTEYWQKGASLLHTDPLGTRDVDLPANVRTFLMAGTQHTGRAGLPADAGPCMNPRNPHDPMPALRALLVALDEWVTSGRPPPDSRVPRIADGTLVPAADTGFPAIPGMAVAREANDVVPPADWVSGNAVSGNAVSGDTLSGPAYRPLVPKVDADGNEAAGVRLPDIAVPLGTRTGWNLYRAPWAEGELADRDGSFVPFTRTAAEREAKGDPRPSLAERWPDRAAYVAAVEAAVAGLLAARLLLPEDAAAYVARAKAEPAFS